MGKPAAILSYSGTDHGGNIAGHELRPCLSNLGMLPLPSSLPLAHTRTRKVAQFMPWSLRELVRYAAVLRPLRERPHG